MLEYFMYIHGVLWFVVGIILLVGNLTYADYYTKLDKNLMHTFWICYGIVSCAGIVNFVIAGIINLLTIKNEGPDPLTYGLGWLTVGACILYVILAIVGTIVGFTKLKQYFGHKRNKI